MYGLPPHGVIFHNRFGQHHVQGNREFQRDMEKNERRLAREHERLELRKKEREQRKINKRREFNVELYHVKLSF